MIAENKIKEYVERMFEEIKFPSEPSGLYEPLEYMIKIGGKRLRPRLCLTTYALFCDELDDTVLEPARALEVFHTFTLIHDDIMDRSPLRRGMPTVWKKWGEDVAILSGDVMQTDAYKRVAKAPLPILDKVLDLFSTTAAQVCEGQQYDMDFESYSSVSMPEYEKMIGLKTAVLLACSAKMGGLLADAGDKECDILYKYGYQLGMAFQIADDYLDAYGDEKVFGKPIGGDILNQKKSWLTVRALEKTPDNGEFMKLFSSPAEDETSRKAKIAGVKAMYDKLGVAEDARIEINKFASLALNAASELNLGAVRYESLRRFSEGLVGRVK